MRALALTLVSLIIALAMPARAGAQQPLPRVRAVATLSASSVALGERLRLTVTVVHPGNVLVSVDPPARTATLQLVEVVPRPATPLAATDSEVTSHFEYVIAVFALGNAQLPPLVVSWLDAEGETGEVQAAPPPFAIAATSAPSDTALRPLKPQLDVAGAPPPWQRPAAIATVLGLVFGVVGATVAVRRRRRPATQTAPVPLEALAESTARRRLDVIATANPLVHGDYDAYYGTIATVVRDYLEQRFGFNARSLTTSELQQRMVALGVERWQARLVSGLLDRCDAAVYAGRRPDPISADHDLTVAFEIVELARPQQVATAEGRDATTVSNTTGAAR